MTLRAGVSRVALACALAWPLAIGPAWADGGAGGGSGGGTGGADSFTSIGGNGGSGSSGGLSGAGGGGGGAGNASVFIGTGGGDGGPGGSDFSGDSVGPGGFGGAGGPAQNGGPGTSTTTSPFVFGSGGGGGGGGAAGFTGATVPDASVFTGGTGGGGGNGGGPGGGGGGGAGAAGVITNGSNLGTLTSLGATGGAGGRGGDGANAGSGGSGGAGLVITGGGALGTFSQFTISGNNGGAGGNGTTLGGNGGAGGAGLLFSNGGAATSFTINNSSSIAGGKGGAAGTGGSAANGAGGAGIVGANLTIIVNGATVQGGLDGSGANRANALSFTGGSNVLELDAGSAITGNVVAFTTADTLRLGGTTDASFDVSQIGTQYLGFGVFVKNGGSTWTLTGTNTAALPWSINAGTLAVNGVMANATMTVNAGGTLTGAGTVGNTQINGGGTLAPGNAANSTGTLTITGDLVLQSAATYMVTFAGTNASLANVSGTAQIGGAILAAAVASPLVVGKNYLVLQSGAPIVGSFANGPNGATFTFGSIYKGTIDYTTNPDDVYLDNIQLTSLAPLLPPGEPANVLGVVNTIDNFIATGGVPPAGFANLFNLSGTQLAAALNALTGEASTGASRSGFQLTNALLNIVFDMSFGGAGGGSGTGGAAPPFAEEDIANLPPDIALAYASMLKKAPPPQISDQHWSVWGSAFGGYNTSKGDPVIGSSNVTARAYGFAAGMDYHFTPDSKVGFALAGAGSNWALAQALGGGRSDSFQAVLDGMTRSGPAYLAAALVFANHWFTTTRTAAFGDQLRATFQGQSYGGRLEGGYRYAVMPMAGVTPYAAVQPQWFHTPSYSETDLTGGGFALSFNSMTASDTRTELGTRTDYLTVAAGVPLILGGRLAWAHDFIHNPALGAVFQALPGASFTVNGATAPKDSALASADAELRLTANWSLTGKFDGEFARGSQTYAGTGTLRYSW